MQCLLRRILIRRVRKLKGSVTIFFNKSEISSKLILQSCLFNFSHPFLSSSIMQIRHFQMAKSRELTYLCTGVDCVTNIETSRPVKKNSVQEITLTRSVHSCHRNYSDWACKGLQKALAFFVNLKLYCIIITLVRHHQGRVTYC